jgi:hypothetical protein
VPKRIGSTNGLIDWDNIIKNIMPRSGDYNSPSTVTDRVKDDPNVNLGYYKDIMDTWEKANYDFKNIEWWDYYPGEHFDIGIQDTFAGIVNAEPRRVFISEVMPGQCVPYHWDVEDNEKEWLTQGQLVRYVCFIDTPQFAHALILGDECFYNIEQGEIYQWDHYRDYHAGTNAGQGPYYLFHFLGISND